MKKILSAVLAVVLMFSLVACGSKGTGEEKNIEGTLSEIMAKITDVPSLETIMVMEEEITKDNYTYNMKTEMVEGMQGLMSNAAIGSQAHSIVLIRLPKDADGDAIAKEILEKNTDGTPSKWVCVEAEKVEVVRHGDLILFVQSWEETTGEVVAKFNELAK